MWKPIDSAPKDGTEVLLVVVGKKGTGDVFIGSCLNPDLTKHMKDWKNEGWYEDEQDQLRGPYRPTHWMAIPDPPEVK